MLERRELAGFRKQLLAWFRQFQRDLPWRKTNDPYHIWLSETMLQQTRVAAAIPYYQRFLEHFPDVHALSSAPPEEVLRLWSGLGYYRRARNLQKAAQQIVARHGGKFPSTLQDVLALPGIGNYTAAAILSMAFRKNLAVLDGNVARVLARLGAIRGDLRESKRWQKLQSSADTLLERGSPGDWNQAMMELGATLCTPKSPQCRLCPVRQFCKGRRQGIAELLPKKRKKRATVEVTLATGVFLDKNGRTLLLPPPESSNKASAADHVPTLVSKLWHFPTVPVSNDPAENLAAFLRKVLSPGEVTPSQLIPLEKVRHAVTYRSVSVLPFLIGPTTLPSASGAKQIRLGEISRLPISNLTRKVARAALQTLSVPLLQRTES